MSTTRTLSVARLPSKVPTLFLPFLSCDYAPSCFSVFPIPCPALVSCFLCSAPSRRPTLSLSRPFSLYGLLSTVYIHLHPRSPHAYDIHITYIQLPLIAIAITIALVRVHTPSPRSPKSCPVMFEAFAPRSIYSSNVMSSSEDHLYSGCSVPPKRNAPDCWPSCVWGAHSILRVSASVSTSGHLPRLLRATAMSGFFVVTDVLLGLYISEIRSEG